MKRDREGNPEHRKIQGPSILDDFRRQNHYEILNLSVDASPYEVRRAYQEALEIYHEDSLVTYSLFTPQERREIRARLDEAFSTLIHEERRAQYDRSLGAKGKPADGIPPEGVLPLPVPALDLEPSGASSKVRGILQEELQARAQASGTVQSLMAQEVITGADLRKVREELHLPLEQIAQQTKIRIQFLRALEADSDALFPSRYHLRSFLKAYLRALQLDADGLAARYLKRWQQKL